MQHTLSFISADTEQHFIICIYLATACFFTIFCKKCNTSGNRTIFYYWCAITSLVVILTINKHLHILTMLNNALREMSKEQEWYDIRQNLQIATIAVIGALAIGIILFIKHHFRYLTSHCKSTLFFLTLLCSFVFIRATSIHQIDVFINTTIAGIRLNLACESFLLIIPMFITLKALFTPTLPNP